MAYDARIGLRCRDEMRPELAGYALLDVSCVVSLA